jgi:outer membrane receptor protein involved in Fe transport
MALRHQTGTQPWQPEAAPGAMFVPADLLEFAGAAAQRIQIVTTGTIRTRLLASSMICGAALTGLVATAAQAETESQVSELIVTGTRLPRPNLEQPTPVAVLTPQLIRNAGPQNLGDIIARLPEVGSVGTVRANSNNDGSKTGPGVSAIDLRGLGLSRTLVLVDGQRHVAGDIIANAVDVNSIPKALVERVEVITGGASAIYGSDAVTGVVNIITKTRFEGLQIDAQTGGYDNGFGAKSNLAITGGKTFFDGRLNLALSGFWSKEDGVEATDLPGAQNYRTIVNPADTGGAVDPTFRSSGAPIPNNGVPDRLWVPNVGSELTTRTGVLINAFGLAATSFDAAGHVVPTPARSGYNSFAYGQLPAHCEACFFPDDFTQVSSPLLTKGADLKANMDFSGSLHGFLDAKFVQNDVQNAVEPSILSPLNPGGLFFLHPDNAFLTPQIKAALDPSGLYVFSRLLNDGREQDIRRKTYRIVAGLSGDFDARFAQVNWNGALNYGETDTRSVWNGVRILDNFAAALDSVIDPATGQPVCRSKAPGCVPYNPFGLLNSPAAMAYSFGSFATKDRLTQQVANLNANFDTGRFFELQGGPIGVAAGAEYRMERAQERNDPMLLAGATEFAAADSSGGFNVVEGYLELNAPVLRRAGPGLDELSFDVAYRGAHYSTVGGVGAYKISGVYGPASWVKFRGTYSRAIRAPNITEAFQPVGPTFFSGIKDPCSVENINSNVNYAKNCAAAGLPAGFVAMTNASISGTNSGNSALQPETSLSYTGGVVLQPPMAPGLAITLDYYSIKIKNAIAQVQAQDVVNNCYGSSAGLDPTYCGLFTRDATLSNIDFIHTTFVNASKLYTNGLELQVSYATDVAPLTRRWRYTRALDGRLSFNLTADYVMHLRNYPFQFDPSQVNVLEGTATTAFGNNPQVKGIASLDYRQGPVEVDWTTRYVGKQALFSRDPSAADGSESLNVPFTDARFYHDLTVSYRLGGAMAGTELFAGANNIFDVQPPAIIIGSGRDMAFDLGRFLFVGARYRR